LIFDKNKSMDKKTERLIDIIRDAKSKYSEENLVLVIPKFMSKSFTSFCSIREDLLLIKKYLEKLEIEKDVIISSALTYSLISIYGKCFTDATKSKSPKLEPKQIYEEGSNFLMTHDYLMDLRHNFIAHRGDTENEVEAAYLLIPKEEGEPQVRYAQKKRMNLNSEKRNEISELVEFLLPIVMDKIQKSGQKTYNALFDNFTPEQMSFMLINNVKDEK